MIIAYVSLAEAKVAYGLTDTEESAVRAMGLLQAQTALVDTEPISLVPADLPDWRRAAFHEVLSWMTEPPTHRALLLSGARQVGKTTLLLQTIEALLARGAPPDNILYATFSAKTGGSQRLARPLRWP